MFGVLVAAACVAAYAASQSFFDGLEEKRTEARRNAQR